ncbi:uncharacterized protein LOC125502033 isoform X2 [Athalia rosae]|uniref:uncharacterized protein LOC125502033 isoform X2 n=1 Tax=Athalia rosae TaxID=37344 RepID=UPI0020340CCC|nr:uncharacterized protein LOC125502033 isoform X2 [Athalia rosae]
MREVILCLPPDGTELRRKWIDAARGLKTLSTSSFVCSNHFLPKDYANWTQYGRKKILKKMQHPAFLILYPPMLMTRFSIKSTMQ